MPYQKCHLETDEVKNVLFWPRTYPKKVRSFDSDIYIAEGEKVLFELVKKKVDLKKEVAIHDNVPVLYLKSYFLEEEILNENPPKCVSDLHSTYRRQIITKSCKKLGFERQGKHNAKPLLKLVLHGVS